MKTISKSLFAVLAMAILLPTAANAYDFMSDGLCYNFNADGTSVTVTYQEQTTPSYSDLHGNLVIPESVTHDGVTYSVTSIGSVAFLDCKNLTGITIPTSIESIGNEAIEGCDSLTFITWNAKNCTISGPALFNGSTLVKTITIGDDVETLTDVFGSESLRGVTHLTVGKSVKSIGDFEFRGCSNLNNVTWNAISCSDFPLYINPLGGACKTFTFGDEVERIPAYICSDKSVESISIPESVTYIGKGAFRNCTKLESSITIHESVETVGNLAFENCTSLTNVQWNTNKCKDFEQPSQAPFFGCKNIKTVSFGDEVDKIPSYLFSNSGVENIAFNTVKTIGVRAFWGCSGLTSLTLPETVSSIGMYAFEGCSGLTSVELPNNLKFINLGMFKGCSNLSSINIPNTVKSIGMYSFQDCTGLTSIIIPDSVTGIMGQSFLNCTSLESVTIGKSVSRIYDSSFKNCPALTSVTWNARNSDIDFYKNRLSMPFPDLDKSSIKSFIIGDEVENIPPYLCWGMNGLENVTIPNSVTFIGKEAFLGCRGLTSITIPNSVTSIGASAFYNCINLANVTTPDSITSVGSNAFENTLWFDNQPNGLVYVGLSAYKYKGTMPAGTDITVKNGTVEISGGAFEGCSGLASVTIPNSVTSVGQNAFLNCSGLNSVAWNAKNCNDFSSSADAPFNGLTGIEYFTFGNEVEYIPARLCYGLSGLKSVTIPSFVNSIGTEAFRDCSGLMSVYSSRMRPPAVRTDGFYGVDVNSCVLYVPKGSEEFYWVSPGWNEFVNIIEWEPSVGPTPTVPGDVNGDRQVSVADVTCIYDVLTGASTANQSAADTNGDGEVTVADVTAVYNVILGVE